MRRSHPSKFTGQRWTTSSNSPPGVAQWSTDEMDRRRMLVPLPAFELLEVQAQGKKKMAAIPSPRGQRITPGTLWT